MARATLSLDLSEVTSWANRLAQSAGPSHRRFLTGLGAEVQSMMRERLLQTYRTEIEGDEEGRSRPTQTSGSYGRSLTTGQSKGGRVNWIRANVPYASRLEAEGFSANASLYARMYPQRRVSAKALRNAVDRAVAGRDLLRRQGRTLKQQEMFVRGQIARGARTGARGTPVKNAKIPRAVEELIVWATLKFGGSGTQTDRIVRKVLRDGYRGRHLMASAFTERTSGGKAFQTRYREHVKNRYAPFLVQWYQGRSA